MSENHSKVAQIYRIVYDATTTSMPNLGGHHGIYGNQKHIGLELLRFVGELDQKMRNGPLIKSDLDQLRGHCRVAQASGAIAENDLEKIDKVIDTLYIEEMR